jgi:hypothetical protein
MITGNHSQSTGDTAAPAPHSATFVRTWQAHRGRAWVARIVGKHPAYGLRREFLPRHDITTSNNLYRQIEIIIEADEDDIFEWYVQAAANREERGFWQVQNGQLVAITRRKIEHTLSASR